MPGNEVFSASPRLTVARPPDVYTPRTGPLKIAHLSDIHCGGYFVADLMERAIADINALETDIVVCSGDLTTFGFKEEFAGPADLRVFVLHHHLLPVPGTGRERNIVYDAGDAIECLQRAGVNLVLCGHKHVPYAWRLENLFVINTGTVSSLRLRSSRSRRSTCSTSACRPTCRFTSRG